MSGKYVRISQKLNMLRRQFFSENSKIYIHLLPEKPQNFDYAKMLLFPSKFM